MPIERPQPYRDILNRVYDDSDDTIKTKMSGDIQIGAVEIKDGDSDNRAEVTSNGQLLTNIYASPDDGTSFLPVKCDNDGRLSGELPRPKEGFIENNTVITVPASTLTTIINYVHTGDDAWIMETIAQSDAAAVYSVYINGNLKLQKRQTAANLTFKQEFYSYPITSGDIILLRVEHFESGTRDFNGTILFQR